MIKKQIKKDKLIPSIKKSQFFYNSLLVFGEPWMICIVISYLCCIFFIIWREHLKLDIWSYLVLASGSIPATLRVSIKPINPFGESWLRPRATATLTEEERRALSFLKTSKKLKKITIIIGFILFILIFIFPLISFLGHYSNYNYYSKTKILISLFGVTFLYYIFSELFLLCIIYCYLITHWDEIQQSGIEPWPKDKPYSTGPFRYCVPEEGSFIGDILSIDPNMAFNWHDFSVILVVFLSICLIFWGTGAISIIFSKMSIAVFTLKTISFTAGIIILNISAKMWYKKHKKK